MKENRTALFAFHALVLLGVFTLGCGESEPDSVAQNEAACEEKFSMINVMNSGSWIKTDESVNCAYDQSDFQQAAYQCDSPNVTYYHTDENDFQTCYLNQNCSVTTLDGVTSRLNLSVDSSLEMGPPYTGNLTISKYRERVIDGTPDAEILFDCRFTVTELQ